MKAKRRRHEPEFKARVAIEAIKNVRTIQEIAKEYEIHPVQVSEWKKLMLESASDVFGVGRKKGCDSVKGEGGTYSWSGTAVMDGSEVRLIGGEGHW